MCAVGFVNGILNGRDRVGAQPQLWRIPKRCAMGVHLIRNGGVALVVEGNSGVVGRMKVCGSGV